MTSLKPATKVLIMTSKARVDRFSDLSAVPKDWKIVHVGSFPDRNTLLKEGADTDFLFADAIACLDGDALAAMPRLKLISSEGVGYNGIDIHAAAALGIYVCNHPAINSAAVAEHTVMLMLCVQRRLIEGDRLVRAGQQNQAKERFILEGVPELGHSKVGLIGLGHIAAETATRLKAFGCDVSYYSRHRASPAAEKSLNVRFQALSDLLSSCDIISLHLTVSPETIGYIGQAELARMKPGAILINTGRGELVDQEALAEALSAGRLGGAGIDTLHPEPALLDNNPLLRLPECIQTKVVFSPHIAGTTIACFEQAHRRTWQNFLNVSDGKPPVDPVNAHLIKSPRAIDNA
jgi:phosphoglycerate dehydrogenase-like enzyme